VQTGRLELYRDVVARLHEAGYAYDSYSTDDEVKARRAARRRQDQGYDNYDRRADRRAGERVPGGGAHAGRPVPDARRAGRVRDMVRGEVRFEPGNVPDYVLARPTAARSTRSPTPSTTR
jgi:glutamyl-tRNA synthetase